jgi:hypothetical protein
MKCQDFSAKGTSMDIHFGVEWFKKDENFGLVGTTVIRWAQISVKYGRALVPRAQSFKFSTTFLAATF